MAPGGHLDDYWVAATAAATAADGIPRRRHGHRVTRVPTDPEAGREVAAIAHPGTAFVPGHLVPRQAGHRPVAQVAVGSDAVDRGGRSPQHRCGRQQAALRPPAPPLPPSGGGPHLDSGASRLLPLVDGAEKVPMAGHLMERGPAGALGRGAGRVNALRSNAPAYGRTFLPSGPSSGRAPPESCSGSLPPVPVHRHPAGPRQAPTAPDQPRTSAPTPLVRPRPMALCPSYPSCCATGRVTSATGGRPLVSST